MHRPQRCADGEGGLGQQRSDALEKIAALNAAVQVQIHVTDEARLVAKVQHTLQIKKGRASGRSRTADKAARWIQAL